MTFHIYYSVALSAANGWPNCKEFTCSYPHDLAVLWSTHETLKSDKVNWNRCTSYDPRLNQRSSSTCALCDDQISRQTKRGKYSGHLSQQNPSPSSILQVSFSNNALKLWHLISVYKFSVYGSHYLSTAFEETNSKTPKLLKIVRYGKVFCFNKASFYLGKTIDAK